MTGKRFLFMALLLGSLAIAPAVDAANVVRAFTALTGGGTGAVDKIPIAEIANGDIGIAVTGNVIYTYQFNSAATDAESSPTFIRPDDYATAGVWYLVGVTARAVIPGTADTYSLGSATNEWANIYIGDSGVIYGQNDQSATLTSSASLWTANNLAVDTQFKLP